VADALKIDFMGIGAPKCGSTWLFYALGQHPKICLSEPKEIKYFNHEDFRRPYRPGRDRLPLINAYHLNDFSWYENHYKHCPANMLKGEFSPEYMYDETAARLIHRHFPDINLFACLRKPLDQLYSSFFARSRYAGLDDSETFEQAIDNDPRYLREAHYAKHLKRYFELFDRHQIKVVLMDDIVGEPERTVRDMFEFLELEPNISLDMAKIPKNSAMKRRFISPEPMMRWFTDFLVDHGQAALLHRIRNLGLKNLLMNVSTVAATNEPMRPETRARLAPLFQDDISELEVMLDRDLSAWR